MNVKRLSERLAFAGKDGMMLERMTETYEGRPCKKCGGTTRYKKSRECIRKNQRSDHLSPKQLTNKRNWDRRNSLVRRDKARKEGVCLQCHARPCIDGYQMCAHCREVNYNYRNSIHGYLVARMNKVQKMRSQYEQQLEAVQKELKELQNDF